MKFTTLLTGIAAFTAIGIVGTAQAQTTRTWDGSSSTDWNTAANWSGDDVPDSTSEIAVIPNNGAAGFTVNLNTNITCGKLEVYELSTLNLAPTSSATLTVDGSGTADGLVILRATANNYAVVNVGVASGATTGVLQLVSTDSSAAHQIGGDIVLKDDASKLDIEDNDAIFGPYSTFFGSMVGQNASALVELESGSTFHNRITFEGMMMIVPEAGNPTFNNDRAGTSPSSGLVWANLAGTLSLDRDLVLDDDTHVSGSTYRPHWKASSDPMAKLQFNRDSTSLEGNISVCDFADLDFAASVTISNGGKFSHQPGCTVTVAATEAFTFGVVSSPYNGAGTFDPDS